MRYHTTSDFPKKDEMVVVENYIGMGNILTSLDPWLLDVTTSIESSKNGAVIMQFLLQ